jgi:predicted SnoaL-like aldol condensation-catalyzing enzyme
MRKMTRKEIARAFLEDSSSGKAQEAFERYVHEDFRHHLIFFKGDRDSFRLAIEENYRQFPDKRYETLHLLEDGDLVSIHGKVTLGPRVYGVIHIFRFLDDKIIESWEASQEDLAEGVNEHGLF